MAKDPEEMCAKVVLAGPPGSGQVEVLRHVARRYAHASVRAGELAGGEVYRTEFFWPEELPDGRRLRVRLFAVSGRPLYNAVDELLAHGCDGLVFVVDVRPERLDEARESLRNVVTNAARSGADFRTMPVVLQYHHRGETPDFDAARMDRWLGISPGAVDRFTARFPGEESRLCAGVERVIAKIIQSVGPAAEPAERECILPELAEAKGS